MLALDMVLFEQVLFNLLDNAGKYAPEGSLITIAAGRDGGLVTLRVIDAGDGIPADDIGPMTSEGSSTGALAAIARRFRDSVLWRTASARERKSRLMVFSQIINPRRQKIVMDTRL